MGLSVTATNKLSCNLTVKCFDIGNNNIPPNRRVQFDGTTKKGGGGGEPLLPSKLEWGRGNLSHRSSEAEPERRRDAGEERKARFQRSSPGFLPAVGQR